jgi:outer membrane protein assembly factor BamB
MSSRCRSIFIGVTTVLALIAVLSPISAEQNWPKWRGPLDTGAAPDASPPITWSEEENVNWKIKLPGRGTATPIVWGDKIFIQTAIATGEKLAATAGDAGDATKQDSSAKDAAGKQNTRVAQRGDADAGKRDDVKDGAAKREDGGERRGPGGFGGPGDRGRGGFGGPGGRGRGGFGGSPPPTEIHQFVLLCLDRATGKTQWQKIAREEVPHEGHHRDHGFASHSPVTDGKLVIAYFGSRGLHCYDMDGNLQWSKDLGRMRTPLTFGEGSSPALHGNTIVVNWDHEGDDFIAAFDKNSGQELWREPRDERTTWSTPLIVEHDGQAQVITGASGKIRSYELSTGKQLWEAGGLTANVIPSPVASGDMVYLTSGFRGNSLKAIRLGASGDIEETDSIVWRLSKRTPYVPSPLLYQNRLYFVSSNNAILSCYDATTGEPVVVPEDRIEGLTGVYASPVAAAGRVYLVGRNGTTVVIKHAVEPAEDFEILATNELGEDIDASPAIVGNEIFLRGHEHLYCIAEK